MVDPSITTSSSPPPLCIPSRHIVFSFLLCDFVPQAWYSRRVVNLPGLSRSQADGRQGGSLRLTRMRHGGIRRRWRKPQSYFFVGGALCAATRTINPATK